MRSRCLYSISFIAALRDPRYWRHFPERLGGQPISSPATAPGAIWLHAVSVGEVISSAAIAAGIARAFPGLPLYVSVTTVAGREVAKEKLHGLADRVFYAPIDYAFAVRRVLRRIRPSVVVILETEIWPVLYREAKRAGASLVIVNGRISTARFPALPPLAFPLPPRAAIAGCDLRAKRAGSRALHRARRVRPTT